MLLWRVLNTAILNLFFHLSSILAYSIPDRVKDKDKDKGQQNPLSSYPELERKVQECIDFSASSVRTIQVGVRYDVHHVTMLYCTALHSFFFSLSPFFPLLPFLPFFHLTLASAISLLLSFLSYPLRLFLILSSVFLYNHNFNFFHLFPIIKLHLLISKSSHLI